MCDNVQSVKEICARKITKYIIQRDILNEKEKKFHNNNACVDFGLWCGLN